jgi:hypothetical protein
MTTTSRQSIQPQVRSFDGLSIRYTESNRPMGGRRLASWAQRSDVWTPLLLFWKRAEAGDLGNREEQRLRADRRRRSRPGRCGGILLRSLVSAIQV